MEYEDIEIETREGEVLADFVVDVNDGAIELQHIHTPAPDGVTESQFRSAINRWIDDNTLTILESYEQGREAARYERENYEDR